MCRARSFMKRIRVGVLMGGKSIEREVSFNSGRTVCDHLDVERYDIIPLYQMMSGQLYIMPWSFLYRGKTVDFEHRLSAQAQAIVWDDLKELIDILYIALHGRFAEDGTLQGLLEVLAIPYVGTKRFGSALGMEKIMQKKILHAAGIAVPRGIVVEPEQLATLDETILSSQLVDAGVSFPCIVKPHQEGSSLGVQVVTSAAQLIAAINSAAHCAPGYVQRVLIEEKVNGMEFTTIIITDYKKNKFQPLSVTEVVVDDAVQFFDYEQKYMPGKSIQFTPARCNQEQQELIQETCCNVMAILEFKNMGRIDGILTSDGRVVIIDPNSFSGAGPASFMFKQAAQCNMNHTQLINHLIETELYAYGMLSDEFDAQKMEIGQMSSQEKIRVAVLFGGNSNEKEISLESGRNVIYKLSPHKYDPVPVYVNQQLELFIVDSQQLVSSSTFELEKKLNSKQKISWATLGNYADFVFIALHGGAGENGSIQGALEMIGLSYNGSSVLTSALCMDKWKTTSFLRTEGFDVPRNYLLTRSAWQTDRENALEQLQNIGQFPLIVKPHDDGCSVMVSKVADNEELTAAIETIFAHEKEAVLIEEFVRGMELTVGVLGNAQPCALPPSQAVSTHAILSIAEKFLPGAGENQTPAPLPEHALRFVQETMEKVYKAVGCKGYARIDCFYQNAQQSPTGIERVVTLEINTLPGLTPATCIFHQAAEVGMKPMDFIDAIIMFGFEQHASAKKPFTQFVQPVLHNEGEKAA